ncbi:MAG TPA: DUF4345 family protein [Anaerolineales bacterium]|nr:DUF4345 family protein [Anaerolineales bacterium]
MTLQIFQYIACMITTVAGLFALLSPEKAVALTGLTPNGGRGRTEIRCVMGGLYIALGVTPFFLGGVAFTVLGVGYLAIGVVRLVSIFIDRSATPSNWGSFAMEIVLGAILVL